MQGVTLQQLQCLEAVAAEGGLQAAARRLGRTHPAVSAAIRALEAQLGVALFDRSGYRMSLTDQGLVRLVPVCACDYGPAQSPGPITPARVRGWTQCVIRDSARRVPTPGYYLVKGSRRLTVSDQLMKLEVILQGMGWGHMPDFLIAED